MDLQRKKIGIWGFGIVGKAALNYFYTKKNPIMIMESREVTEQENDAIKKRGATLIHQKESTKFLEENDLILASPGIDINKYSEYSHKFITELDLFAQENTAQNNKKQVIAITGTIGKTSITNLLSTIIQKKESLLTGGNIGVGMLDLLKQSDAKKVVLEVSSFQLEHCKLFAPDLALWTNFYPNHLDRHITLEEYFNAKYTMLKYQTEQQNALVPLELAQKIFHAHQHNPGSKGIVHFFSTKKPCMHTFNWLPKKSTLFWIEGSMIVHYKNNQKKELIDIKNLPSNTFESNWLIIIAALELLKIPFKTIEITEKNSLEHRLEKIVHNKAIYNDSKSTIMESTLAAVEKLKTKNIILLLGGLSKGVNRNEYIVQLQGKVKEIICFGAEAEMLHTYAQNALIPSIAFATLEKATQYALNQAHDKDQILLSPGGSSYDLFKNYEERGNCFKRLVQEYFLK